MVLLIFLGILWLKINNGVREGNVEARALSTNILNSVNTQLQASGIDVSSYTAALPGAIDQITNLIKDSAELNSAGGTGQGPPDLSAVIDTTGSDHYPSKSFLTGNKISDGFCKTYTTPTELIQKCGALTPENCNQTDCCIVLNGSKCVAGNEQGPTVQVDENGKDIDYAYYSYKNNCYGSCGKGLDNAANPCAAFSSTDTKVSERCMKRLWAQAGCRNPVHITPEFAASLSNYNKVALAVKFKEASRDEPNYEQCYGPNENIWPAPCIGTTDTSTGLSVRCLKKLFTNAGCTNQATISDAYVSANTSRTKLQMMNTFADFTNAVDDDEGLLSKCYGPEPLDWPDPCANTTDSSNVLDGTLPLRCVQQLFTEKTACPSRDKVKLLQNELASLSAAVKNTPTPTFRNAMSKANIIAEFDRDKNKIQNNRFSCYGMNPNKWPNTTNVVTFSPDADPCKLLTVATAGSDVPATCKQRLQAADVFPTTACTTPAKVAGIKSTIASRLNKTGPIYDLLVNAENDYTNALRLTCGLPKEHLLAIYNGVIFTIPTSDLTQPWTRRDSVYTGIRSIIQLQDKTFLVCKTDYTICTKQSLDPASPLIATSCCALAIVQLNNGTLIAASRDQYLYQTANLNGSWTSMNNPGQVSTIALINGGTAIAGIGRGNYVYTRPATIAVQPWTIIPNTNNVLSITQLANGTFIGVGPNFQLFSRPTLTASVRWSPLSNANLSTIRPTFITTAMVQ